MKKLILIIALVLGLFCFATAANADTFTWYGWVKWPNGTAANATNISLTEMAQGPGGAGVTISNLSNESGYFVLAGLNTSKEFTSSIINYRYGKNASGIGPSLPPPANVYQSELQNITIYLNNASAAYITAVNGSNANINFQYEVKDLKLGYPISPMSSTAVSSATIVLQEGKNYSVTIFPSGNYNAPPVSLLLNVTEWGARAYATRTINVTTSLIRVSGYFKNSSGNLINGTVNITNVTIKKYVLESGNMLIEEASIPENMGQWSGGAADIINVTTAFYNITVPSVAAGFKVALVAYINDSRGVKSAAFKNLTLSGTTDVSDENFTARWLAGAYMPGTYSNTSRVVITATNGSLIASNAHCEVQVDYDGFKFTWMKTANSSGQIAIPLWQGYEIKKLAVYSPSFAPYKKKVKASLINSTTTSLTATLRSFDPASIDGQAFDESLVRMQFIISNSTCDVPELFASNHGCVAMDDSSVGEVSPLQAMLRGKISFRMIKPDAGIFVHYVNVDMMASGPPDALFDNAATDSSAATVFEKLWRFGSSGPEIYDEVLIGINYSSMSVDELAPIRIFMPYLYDDDWNVAWNVTRNGTSGISENLTEYSTFNLTWFNTTTSGMLCYNVSTANCYFNTTQKMIWLRMPHFSGLSPAIGGVSAGNVSVNTTYAQYQCFSNATCTVYINITNGNYTLAQTLQNISINSTDTAGNIFNWTFYRYDFNTGLFTYNFTNGTTHLNYNFTLLNASNAKNTTHMYKVEIYKTSNLTTYWNFTYNVSGMTTLFTLTINLSCVDVCKVWGDWGTCAASSQARACAEYYYNCGDVLTETQSCTAAAASTGGGGAATAYPLTVDVDEGAQTFTMRTTDVVTLKIDGASHSFRVTNIYADYVTFRVKSEGKYYDVKVNETKNVDMDDDGTYDLAVTLKEVITNKKVKLTLERITEEVPETAEEAAEGEAAETGATAGETAAGEAAAGEGAAAEKAGKLWLWILIAVVIVVLAYFLLFHKKSGGKKHHPF